MFFMDCGCCSFFVCELMGCSFGMLFDYNLFIVVDIIMVQYLSEGYYFIDFINVIQIKVFFGDMLGWYSSFFIGKVVVIREVFNDCGVVFEGVMDGLMVGLVIGLGF